MPAFLFQIVVTAISSMVLGVFTGVQALACQFAVQEGVQIHQNTEPQGGTGLCSAEFLYFERNLHARSTTFFAPRPVFQPESGTRFPKM